jgi:hypothetical protein
LPFGIGFEASLNEEPGQLGGCGSLGARQSGESASKRPPFDARMRIPKGLLLTGWPAEFLIRAGFANLGVAGFACQQSTLQPQPAIT